MSHFALGVHTFCCCTRVRWIGAKLCRHNRKWKNPREAQSSSYFHDRLAILPEVTICAQIWSLSVIYFSQWVPTIRNVIIISVIRSYLISSCNFVLYIEHFCVLADLFDRISHKKFNRNCFEWSLRGKRCCSYFSKLCFVSILRMSEMIVYIHTCIL